MRHICLTKPYRKRTLQQTSWGLANILEVGVLVFCKVRQGCLVGWWDTSGSFHVELLLLPLDLSEERNPEDSKARQLEATIAPMSS